MDRLARIPAGGGKEAAAGSHNESVLGRGNRRRADASSGVDYAVRGVRRRAGTSGGASNLGDRLPFSLFPV